jgi:hypothetical protein
VNTLGAAVFCLLTVIALLHLAWGFGMRWPARNERDLVALVIGATGGERMPRLFECVAAAAGIFAAGCVGLLLAGSLQTRLPLIIVTIAGALTLCVFALRGLIAYTPIWRRLFSLQPFAMYDRFFYAPLCIAIACAFAFLLPDQTRTS